MERAGGPGRRLGLDVGPGRQQRVDHLREPVTGGVMEGGVAADPGDGLGVRPRGQEHLAQIDLPVVGRPGAPRELAMQRRASS